VITITDAWRQLRTNPALACAAGLAVASLLIYGLPWLWLLQTQFVHDVQAIDLVNRDFVNYWMAGRMVLAGTEQDLFTQQVYFERLQEFFGPGLEIRNWSYPPHFLLMLWPLGYLDYQLALVVFLGVTFALFVAAVFVFRRNLAPQSNVLLLCCALLSYAVMQLDTMQNGFLTAAFMLFGLAWMRNRPLLAGLAFACLTIKPQLGILIPVLLLWDRHWRTFLWAALFTGGLIGASAVLFGASSWRLYMTETLTYQRSVMTNWQGIFLDMMPTIFGGARALGFSPATATAAQWPVSVAAAVFLLWLLQREREPLHRIFIVVCGTFLITPYAFNYDMGALSAVAAMAASSPRIATHRAAATSIAAIATLSGIVMNLGRSGVPVSPLLFATGLGVIAWSLSRGDVRTPAAARC
jgi:arabinofuranan 3-O-arabinosyltransferase